jgi:CO/xanthine dehydrogenase FAD-binding subunit
MMACGRWSRTSCDVSVLTAAVAYDRTGDGKVRNVRIAMGGLDPHARRYRELEAAFEGKALPDRAAIEAVASPCFHPIDDLRGSAAFKRLRAAVLLADTFLAAEVQP